MEGSRASEIGGRFSLITDFEEIPDPQTIILLLKHTENKRRFPQFAAF